jgi:DNA-directed RNA polymerase specialized sigma24 family protein
MVSKEALWPALDTGYQEEFGPVDPDLHRIAGQVWPHARQLAVHLLRDGETGYRLLKRAVASVSALPAEKRRQIRDPAAYLFQTYKRLVLSELEKVNGRRVRELENAELLRGEIDDVARIERDILIEELVGRMDAWTREVFESLVLGYTFDEIGAVMGSNPHVVRNRFRLALRRLAATLDTTPSGARSKIGHRSPEASRPLMRLRMMRVRLLNPSRW